VTIKPHDIASQNSVLQRRTVNVKAHICSAADPLPFVMDEDCVLSEVGTGIYVYSVIYCINFPML
jgi:hypothetical protein